MYRNLAPLPLGLGSCPDHELIELALTHRFAGIVLNLERFQDHVRTRGMQLAKRHWASSPLRISSAPLPDFWADTSLDAGQLEAALAPILTSLQELKCPLLTATLAAGHDELSYQRNFEHHCRRLDELAQLVAKSSVKLGLSFSALPADRAKFAHPFIQTVEALLALLQVVGAPNVIAVVDLWHWTLGGGGLNEIARLGADRIGDVWLADLPVGYSLDTITREQRFLPGTTGVIDTPAVLSALTRAGYTGPMTAYPHSKQLHFRSREETVGSVARQLDELTRAASARNDCSD